MKCHGSKLSKFTTAKSSLLVLVTENKNFSNAMKAEHMSFGGKCTQIFLLASRALMRVLKGSMPVRKKEYFFVRTALDTSCGVLSCDHLKNVKDSDREKSKISPTVFCGYMTQYNSIELHQE